MIKNLKKNTKKVYALAAICLVLSGAGVLVGARAYASSTAVEAKIQDKIDYPFMNDSEVVGKWEVVDFVEKTDNFKPAEKQWRGEDFLKTMTVLPDGKMAPFEVVGRVSN